MEQEYYYYYETEIGEITICATEHAIRKLLFGHVNVQTISGKARKETFPPIEKEIAMIKETKKQLDEYFCGKRTEFTIPLEPQGTEFQKKDWQALCTIPYGETRTYKQIAEQIGCPKGCRAVGLANNRNPISILIPCHRVIGSNGSLVGYGGGLDIKKKLLELEQKNF